MYVIMLKIFPVPISHLHAFFRKMSIEILCPFYAFLILLSSLYILDTNVFSEVEFRNIFSPFQGFPFTLLFLLTY